ITPLHREARMRLELDVQEQVAVRRPADAGMALALEPDPLAVDDACGDRHLERLRLGREPAGRVLHREADGPAAAGVRFLERDGQAVVDVVAAHGEAAAPARPGARAPPAEDR